MGSRDHYRTFYIHHANLRSSECNSHQFYAHTLSSPFVLNHARQREGLLVLATPRRRTESRAGPWYSKASLWTREKCDSLLSSPNRIQSVTADRRTF